MLMGFVLAHLIGNLKLFLVEGGAQPLRRGAPRHPGPPAPAHRAAVDGADRPDRRVRVPHPRGRVADDRMNRRARPDSVPVEARLRRRRLRVAHDALDRRHHRPVPHLPPAGSHVGHREPRLRPRRSVQQPRVQLAARPGRDRLHPRQHRARRSTCTTAPGRMFQSLGINNPRYNTRGAAFAHGVRRRSSSSATCRSRSRCNSVSSSPRARTPIRSPPCTEDSGV